MNLPVKILIDRAGIVGDDGETHHGVFDISMLRNVPNFVFLAPSNGSELRDMIYFAWKYDKGPVAIRYPRGAVEVPCVDVGNPEEFVPGKMKIISRGDKLAVFALGDMVNTALELNTILEKNSYSATIVNLMSIKPLDIEGITRIISESEYYITLENGVIGGGVGEYIYSNLPESLASRRLFSGGFPDKFVTHGKSEELFREHGIDPEGLYQKIAEVLESGKSAEKINAVS